MKVNLNICRLPEAVRFRTAFRRRGSSDERHFFFLMFPACFHYFISSSSLIISHLSIQAFYIILKLTIDFIAEKYLYVNIKKIKEKAEISKQRRNRCWAFYPSVIPSALLQLRMVFWKLKQFLLGDVNSKVQREEVMCHHGASQMFPEEPLIQNPLPAEAA